MEKVKYTETYARELFDTNPRNSTLFGVSEMLDKYNIETDSYQIEEKEKINRIPTPFIAGTETENVLVLSCENDIVTYLRQGKKEIMSKDFFISIWDGYILLFESNNQSTESDYLTNKLKTILIDACLLFLTALTLTFLILYFVSIENKTWSFYLFLLSNLLGVYISFLLFLELFENTREKANKICKLINQKSSCGEITNSEQGKLFGVISWSVIGLTYFVSNVLLIISYPISIPSILFINSFALLYTCWSIWYQQKVGKWCALCLLVQSVFVFNFILGLIGFESVYSEIEFQLICFVFLTYAVLFAFIYLSKYPINWFFEKNNLEKELSYLKSDKDVFSVLMERQPKVLQSNFESSVYKGNQNSSFVVTIITNPRCKACAALHKRLKRVEKQFDRICIQYVFAVNHNEREIDARFLIAAALKNDNRLIDLWFQTEDKASLHEKNKYDLYTDEINKEYLKHKSFVKRINPKGTPTILVNGVFLPDYYSIDDIIESKLIPL
ncbi:vitamin K epoxide reductase family protein [Massilibacteroides sp.]|uniref:vitamin K epoxide reductase family protein n=1 Tax=Massilibacteroides sp. TaxID=2034766 RepID=UPI002615423B|nr:vitamin K epoxide reductase family protein [Massilibacteroides sp.]MDD4516815.1 vitamin K epoxide reductase family protein [Massilibacteroides sp.]